MSFELAATALCIAIASGLSPYATVAVLGLAHRFGWIATLPDGFAPVGGMWVITLAVVLTIIEFLATLIPGIASAWEIVHTAIRPPAAAALAVLVAWGSDPALIAATGLVGGTLAFGTSLTKLGVRLAVDTSPEPVSNGAQNVAEFSAITLIAVFAWKHPVLTFVIGLALVIATALFVRALWGMIWRTVRRSRRPGVAGIRS